MQAAHNNSSITSSVNERRFLQHLREMFSAKTTVIAEVLQNARRAGASSVHLDFRDGNLCVTDNGCGIKDFQDLITVAESGWSEEIQSSESPFGIGFFSVSFSAELIRVESRGKQIKFSSDDLIDKRPIHIEMSEFIGGTRITLAGCKLDEATIGTAVCNFAKGFSLPVYWQGEEMPRPHARENLSLIETDVGHLCIGGLADLTAPSFNAKGVVYCQGLPIHLPHFSESFGINSSSVIVHIDHLRFKPRMPDRTALIDADDAYKAINDAIKGIWTEVVETQKNCLDARTFANSFWTVAKEAGCFTVMKDVPYIPAFALDRVNSYPQLLNDWNGYWGHPEMGVTQEAVEQGEVRLFKAFDDDCEDGDEFIRLTAAMTREWLFVERLPMDHWAQPHLSDLAAMDLKIGGKVLAVDGFSGSWVSATVKLFESLSVCLDGEWIPINEAVSLKSEWTGNNVLFVPKDSGWAGDVLKQLSRYINEHDEYQETDFDLDCEELQNLLAIMAGEMATNTVQKCLLAASVKSKRNLFNKVFIVSFDDEGNPAVTEQ